jgi:hypothetical protein
MSDVSQYDSSQIIDTLKTIIFLRSRFIFIKFIIYLDFNRKGMILWAF